jgi:hypothetical protein
MFGRLLFWREEPWEGEAKESRPWVDEAQRNLAAAELDVRRTRALLDKAIDEAIARVEEPVAELEAAGDRLARLERIVDRLEGADARGVDRRLQLVEKVLAGELGRVRL